MSIHAIYDVPAPAKLNTFLHVVGRRADGYHLIQSAFMLIDWCDTLHFEMRPEAHLSREDLTAALPADDLVLRAARLLQQRTGCTLGCHIQIDKQIPSQAGMGGGSSDAASCLLALNRLWGLRLPVVSLQEIGLELGADIPFFLGGCDAWVEGIGERITPLGDERGFPAADFIVIKPSQGLDTARIFSDSDLGRDTPSATIADFAASPFDFGRNDLQLIASRLCPEIRVGLDWLVGKGLEGRMTGSGSAIFARLQYPDFDFSDAPTGWQVRQCKNLKAHPLARWADSAN